VPLARPEVRPLNLPSGASPWSTSNGLPAAKQEPGQLRIPEPNPDQRRACAHRWAPGKDDPPRADQEFPHPVAPLAATPWVARWYCQRAFSTAGPCGDLARRVVCKHVEPGSPPPSELSPVDDLVAQAPTGIPPP